MTDGAGRRGGGVSQLTQELVWAAFEREVRATMERTKQLQVENAALRARCERLRHALVALLDYYDVTAVGSLQASGGHAVSEAVHQLQEADLADDLGTGDTLSQ